jgi:hypothetical protein
VAIPLSAGTRLCLGLTTGGSGDQVVHGARNWWGPGLGLTQHPIMCGDQGFPGAHNVPKCAWDGAGYLFCWLPWFIYLPHATICAPRLCAGFFAEGDTVAQ